MGNSCSAAGDVLLRMKASASHRHSMAARTDQATADVRVALAGRPGRGGSGTQASRSTVTPTTIIPRR